MSDLEPSAVPLDPDDCRTARRLLDAVQRAGWISAEEARLWQDRLAVWERSGDRGPAAREPEPGLPRRTVLVNFVLERDGRIVRITADSPDPRLRELAIRRVRSRRHTPALADGKPVPVFVIERVDV